MDSSPALVYTVVAGTTTPLPTSCSTSGTVNPASGTFTLAGATSTSATIVAQPMCGSFREPPPNVAPGPANDVWFHLTPPPTPTHFRFTLFGGTAPAMVSGAMALYEAPNASGPFRLIECAIGGSLSSSLATLETRSYTPGNKLYLRVWDRTTRSSSVNFSICVQGQTVSSMPARGAGETACSATPLAAATLSSTTATSIDYVFAQEESPSLFTDSSYVGGDLWLSLTVPPSGVVRMAVGRGSAAAGTALNIGLSAYIAANCAAPAGFRQVGTFNTALPAAFPTTGTSNWQINCLPPGETLYLRIHSNQAAQANQKRYGRFRIVWAAGPAVGGTPPANNQPCGATPLSFNASCPVAPAGGNNFNACSTPGIPLPGCGGFDGSSNDVWFRFVAPPSGTVKLEATAGTGIPANPAMALYTTGGHGCEGRFTLMECDDRLGPGNSARIIRTGLVPGQTYYVRAWAEGASATGTFDICLTEPQPPTGSCFYLLELWALNQAGVQHVEIIIGTDTTTVSTSGGDSSERFLLTIPNGATVRFRYFQVDGSRVSGAYSYALTRLGDPTLIWSQGGGVPVFGPGLPWNPTHVLTDACATFSPLSSDCLGSRTICNAGTTFGQLTSTLIPGNTYDLNVLNMGCLSPAESNGIEWLVFRPNTDGLVAFWLDATANAPNTDLDFAVWDAGYTPFAPSEPHISAGICAPNGPPVRCSSARRNYSTGLQAGLIGVEQEGTGGWGWLSPLPVQMDHAYLIAVTRAGATPAAVGYQLRWTLANDPSGIPAPGLLDCTPLILPVEYLFLEAAQRSAEVDVTWATATELNSSHFIVERSADGRTFSPIGLVEAAGNSIARSDYRFTDEAPLLGTNYYRLQQVDHDGATETSRIVTVVLSDRNAPLVIFPNPTEDRVHLSIEMPRDRELDLLLSDAQGRVLLRERRSASRGRTEHDMEVGMLAPGVYHIQVMGLDGTSSASGRFLKR